uniref:Uncharacterized protein LOC113786681 n=1 Tax=Cicer arietinum TaxID=3827 RepID=A0A3Q7Y0A0_CICAR|nr:uncharacterized protein LOC113786681 [Cicer arietinum]
MEKLSIRIQWDWTSVGSLVHYELLNVEDDEDVELMFDVHKQWPQLGSIELYVTFEDDNPLYDIGQPSSSTTPHLEYHFETQNTYQPDSYQPEPYFDHAETSEPEPSQLEPYIPLGDMTDFDQQEISEESEEETYFDEDEDDEGDNDNGDDLELTYDPPFHMCNLNLDNTYQSSEFDMQSNEPPPLDASLEIGMKASLSQKSNQWVIGRLKGPHNCANSSMSQDHTKLDSNIICESIKSLLKADPSIKVKVIIAHIRERYNYTITYRKAWMAKNKAIETIYGNWEKSYNDLPRWLLTMQKFIPGTIVEMEVSVAYPDNTLLQGCGSIELNHDSMKKAEGRFFKQNGGHVDRIAVDAGSDNLTRLTILQLQSAIAVYTTVSNTLVYVSQP